MNQPARGIEVIAAHPRDLDAITGLESMAFEAPWKRAFFESELAAEGRYATVAKDSEGRILGYLFAMYFDDEMHVNKIAVHESHRRQGIALALMDSCFEFAAARGIREISLEVRQSNAVAQSFYTSLDFGSLYIRPRYYPDGESAVVMMRELDFRPPARF